MNILQLVHNPVFGDARVRKYIRTLGSQGKGYNVHVIGVDNKMMAKIPDGGLNEGESTFKILELVEFRKKIVLQIRQNFAKKMVSLFDVMTFITLLITSIAILFYSFLNLDYLMSGLYYFFNYLAIIFESIINNIRLILSDFPRNIFYIIFGGSVLLNLFFIFKNNFVRKKIRVLKRRIARLANVVHSPYKMKKKINSFIYKLSMKSLKPFSKLFSFYAFYRVIKEELIKYTKKEIDVIHVHDHVALFPVLLNRNLFQKTKIIWDAHELYIDRSTTGLFISTAVHLLLKFYRKNVDQVFTINESFKKIYSQKYFKNIPIEVIMNASDFDKTIDRDSKSSKIQKYINSEKKILLFQGGLAKNRGIEDLLIASKNITKDWNIVFMGTGHLKTLVKEYAEKNKNIYLIPPVDQKVLFDWTSSATLGIIPYRNTSKNHLYCTPNKLWEFTNAGVPFVGTDLVEIGRFINQNKVGFLLKRNFSPNDISNLINSIDNDQIIYRRDNCIIKSKKLSWDSYKPKIISIYNKFQSENSR